MSTVNIEKNIEKSIEIIRKNSYNFNCLSN